MAGRRTWDESDVRIRREALEALAAQKEQVLTRAFPLLESAEDGNGAKPAASNGGATATAEAPGPVPSGLEELLGGGGPIEDPNG